jgi:hypothetical protein
MFILKVHPPELYYISEVEYLPGVYYYRVFVICFKCLKVFCTPCSDEVVSRILDQKV